MKLEKTKNAKRIIFFDTISKIYNLFIPFLIRTLMIRIMGIQYIGLGSLFTSILSVLNLAELGVGSAMVFSMYRSVAEDDKEKTCALMKVYRLYYRIIGLVIGMIGICIIPILPQLIEENSLRTLPSDINIYVLYGLYLISTVFTYWLFAYKNCILSAYQRNDIATRISMVTATLQYALQVAVICILKNYYLYIITVIVTEIANNIITAVVVSKLYPEYKCQGNLSKKEQKEIGNRIKDMFLYKIGGVFITSVDTLVISAYLGITVLAQYNNYYYVVSAICGFVNIIHGACLAGVGNSLLTETKEKIFSDLKKFFFLFYWILGVCCCCFLCLFQPFITVWVGKENLLSIYIVVFFCIYFFFLESEIFLGLYRDAAGLWHEDVPRTFVACIANLCLNLWMVRRWGVYGILASTFIQSIVISVPWMSHYVFRKIFTKMEHKYYIQRFVMYLLVTGLTCMITYGVCSVIPESSSMVTLIIRLPICLVLPNILFFIFYRKREEFGAAIHFVDRMTNGKIKLLKKIV